MIPLLDLCGPCVTSYSKRRNDENLADLECVQHKVFDGGQGDDCFSSAQAHIQEKSRNRVCFDILRAVALVIVRNELHLGITSLPSWPQYSFSAFARASAASTMVSK